MSTPGRRGLLGGPRATAWVWWAGAALALLVTLLLQSAPEGTVRQWEQRFTDAAWRHLAQPLPERRVVLIDIDERSVSELGPWPWSRDTQARLMDALAGMGVRQQIWDVVFAGPGAQVAGNESLSRAIAQHRPVLAQVFGMEAQPDAAAHRPLEGQLAGALPWANCPEPFETAQAYLANNPALLATGKATAVGHITPRLAQDGVLRHQPAVVCAQGKAYPALALAAVSQAMGSQNWRLHRGGPLEAPWSLTLWPEAASSSTAGTEPSPGPSVQRAPRSADQAVAASPLLTIPLEANGDWAVGWHRHPDGWFSLNASDVLAGRVPKGLLSGTWVVVGGSAFGLNDRIVTPLQSSAAGFVAHAQLLANALDASTPTRPLAHSALEAGLALAVFGFLAGLSVFTTKSSPAGGAAAVPNAASSGSVSVPAWIMPAAMLSPLFFLGLHVLLLSQGVVLGWMAPACGVALAGLTVGAWAQARNRIERERLYGHLASYLPERVAQVLAGRSPSDRIDARAEEVVVMFADIRNFSAYCEARPPTEAAAVLHAFYTCAHQTVQAHGGVLEALQADSIIAVWPTEASAAGGGGTTLPGVRAAVAAAVELQQRVVAILPDPAPAGLEPLALGIGLESGPCMSGSIGPASRRTHLVMGRTVTIASRLVEMTAELAHPILVGEGLAARLGGALGTASLRSLGTFMLEGLRVPHHIYAWLDGGAGIPSHRPGVGSAGARSAPLPPGPLPSGTSTTEGPPATHLH